MKVVFLDIDGVLNHAATRSTVSPTGTEPLPIPIAPECMARLNRLVAETGAKVVISSSWRKFARWQDLGPALVRHGLVADVIGETSDLVNDKIWLVNWSKKEGANFTYERLERGWEIGEWLAAHPEVEQFVILDDCSDMDYLKPWLVLTHPCDGLDDPDVERAKWILEQSTAGLAVARARALGTTPDPALAATVAAMDKIVGDPASAIEAGASAQCSFCDKDRAACKRLISGRRGAYICDACVSLCALVCDENDPKPPEPPDQLWCNICGRVAPDDQPCPGCGSP